MFNIALYQPDIPQNAAAIIRLCSCFNTTLEIIEPCGFHLDDKRLKKVAMDYLDKSKIITYKSYENFLLKKKNSRIILMTTKAKKIYYNFKFKSQDTYLLEIEELKNIKNFFIFYKFPQQAAQLLIMLFLVQTFLLVLSQ